MYGTLFQHCFICRPSDSTVLEDAGIEPMSVAGWDSSHLTTWSLSSRTCSSGTKNMCVSLSAVEYWYGYLKLQKVLIQVPVHKGKVPAGTWAWGRACRPGCRVSGTAASSQTAPQSLADRSCPWQHNQNLKQVQSSVHFKEKMGKIFKTW